MPAPAPSRLAGLLIAVATLSCTAGPGTPATVRTVAGYTEVRPTPAPPFAATALLTVGRSAVLAYADSLSFRLDQMSGDAQHLRTVNGSLGPYVRVQPEIGNKGITRIQLGQGRIIGRVTAYGDYRPLGLAQGVNYLWVDSAATGGWRAIMIPGNDRIKMYSLPFAIPGVPHDPRFVQEPQAQIIDEANDDPFKNWYTCDPLDCCWICAGENAFAALDSIPSGAIGDSTVVVLQRVLGCSASADWPPMELTADFAGFNYRDSLVVPLGGPARNQRPGPGRGKP